MALFKKKSKEGKEWELGQDSSVPYQMHLDDDDDEDPGIVNKLYDSFPVSDSSKVTLEKSDKDNGNYTNAKEGFSAQEEMSAQFSTFQEPPEQTRNSPPPQSRRQCNYRIPLIIVIVLAIVAVIVIAASLSLTQNSDSPTSQQQTGSNNTKPDSTVSSITTTQLPTVELTGTFTLLNWDYTSDTKTNNQMFEQDFCTEIITSMTSSGDKSINSANNCKVEVAERSRRDTNSVAKEVTFSMQFHPAPGESQKDILSRAANNLQETFTSDNPKKKKVPTATLR